MNSLKNIAKYVIIFSVTFYLLYVSYTSIDPAQLGKDETRLDFLVNIWKGANKFFLFLSAIFAILSHLIRAERWRILLQPIGFKVSLWHSFTAVMNGYFVNLAVPRGGEISRPYTLKKLEGVPAETGIGTVVMERLIDLVFLLICIGSVFVFQITQFSDFFNQIFSSPEAQEEKPPFFTSTKIIAGSVILVLGVATYLFLITKKKYFLKRLIVKIKLLLVGLKSGLGSIFKLEKRWSFIFYSFLIWVMYYLMLYAVVMAFPETKHLSFMDGLTIFVIGGIAMALPMPGGTGTYHFLVPQGLVLLCGIASESKAIAFATIFHGWQTLVIILLGFIGLVVIQKHGKQNTNVTNKR